MKDSMRSMKWACGLVALIFTAVVDAGQVYGTIVSEGKGVASASVEIKCGTAEPVTGSTAADGAYRINVPPQGWGAPPPLFSPARIPRSTTSTW
jgi:hypothetical protein